MYEHATEYGLIYRSRPPYEVLKTNWLGFGEILRIRQVEEILEVYYNSGQYATAIRLLETQYASAFAMFAELGTFYEEHGYFGMGHSRMRRAEILLEFAKERKPGLLPVLERVWYMTCMKERISEADPRGQQMRMNGNR